MQSIYKAAANGDISFLELALTNGEDLSKLNEENLTPLIIAILNNQDNVIKFLVKNIDINKPVYPYPNENTAKLSELIYAIEYRNLSVVQTLLKIGAKIDAECEGYTPLGRAIDSGNFEVVELLLHYGADVNKSNSYGFSPLQIAVTSNNNKIIVKRMVDYLIANGADANYVNQNNSYSALGLVIYDNNIEVAKFLLNYINDQELGIGLMMAFDTKNIDIVRLIENVANSRNDCPITRGLTKALYKPENQLNEEEKTCVRALQNIFHTRIHRSSSDQKFQQDSFDENFDFSMPIKSFIKQDSNIIVEAELISTMIFAFTFKFNANIAPAVFIEVDENGNFVNYHPNEDHKSNENSSVLSLEKASGSNFVNLVLASTRNEEIGYIDKININFNTSILFHCGIPELASSNFNKSSNHSNEDQTQDCYIGGYSFFHGQPAGSAIGLKLEYIGKKDSDEVFQAFMLIDLQKKIIHFIEKDPDMRSALRIMFVENIEKS